MCNFLTCNLHLIRAQYCGYLENLIFQGCILKCLGMNCLGITLIYNFSKENIKGKVDMTKC